MFARHIEPASAEEDEAPATRFPTLNDGQRQAVTATEPAVLVVAGAGTGKTMTLACRVAWLIDQGTMPQRILLLTFTRRAAREMLGRAARMTTGGRDAGGRAWGGTFHAVANRLLRAFGGPLGIRPDFTVLDQADAADLMNLIRGQLRLGQGERRFPKKDTLASIYSRTVNAQTKLVDVLERDFPWCAEEVEGIREVFRRYVERKRAGGVLDFDDLLLFWRALALDPRAGPRVADLFDHVLVDEYQDTNALQADILHAMCGSGRPALMVVGDDAQAIYSFRAATVRNILDFPTVFTGARIVRLEENYRSTPPILSVSNAVIARSAERHEKTLWSSRDPGIRPELLTHLDEADQSDAVCRAVLEARERGTPLRHQAVLFRAAHHSDLLEVELSRRNIPFVKYGGLKFLEAAHVKDVLALLRILENPNDEVSWFRVLQLLDGVGPATARRMAGELGVASGDDVSPLRRLVDGEVKVPAAARPEFDDLRELVKILDDSGPAARPPAPVAVQVERIGRFLQPAFTRLYVSVQSRVRDVEQLANLAGGSRSRASFLADLTLDPPVSTGDLAGPPLLDEDYLILSTIHSAKGCEWDAVHVIHAADGSIPSDMATGHAEQIEEERRLLYVAMTRARNALTVHFPMRYYQGQRPLSDRHAYAQRTRFIPEEVAELFDRRTTYSEDEAVMAAATDVSNGRQAVDAMLGELWG